MIWFLLVWLSLLCGDAQANNVTVRATLQVQGTLTCRDPTDLYSLLFHICNRSVLCRELYYIEEHAPDAAEARSRDFEKFQRQLSLIRLFGAAGEDSSDPNVTSRLFVTHLWPAEWTPYYQVGYNSAQSYGCAQSVNLQAPEQRAFVYSVMNMMLVYKQYISNEHYCNDHNERLLLDEGDGQFHCECRAGKVCQNDQANFNTIMALLAVFVLGLFLVLIVAQVWSMMRYFESLDRLPLATPQNMPPQPHVVIR